MDTDNATQTKTTFLEQHRDAFLAIFKGIGQDHYSLARRILEACWTGIWSDAKLKRTLKIGLFNEVTIGHVRQSFSGPFFVTNRCLLSCSSYMTVIHLTTPTTITSLLIWCTTFCWQHVLGQVSVYASRIGAGTLEIQITQTKTKMRIPNAGFTIKSSPTSLKLSKSMKTQGNKSWQQKS